MTHRGHIITGTILACLLGVFLLMWLSVLLDMPGSESLGLVDGESAVGIVTIEGPIYSSRLVVDQIRYLREDKEVAGMLVRVNSPGGGVAASQEIYDEVRRTRESGIPVLVSMGSVAASGGYYVALGADSIMANPGTTTGSIGVIIELPNMAGLFEKIGYDIQTVQSGRFKDSGGPHRALTEADRTYFQGLIDEFYDQSVSAVELERPMERDEVLTVADGRVFSGRQAQESGLVDVLGSYEDARRLIREMAEVEEDAPFIRMPRRQLDWWTLFRETASRWNASWRSEPSFAYRLFW